MCPPCVGFKLKPELVGFCFLLLIFLIFLNHFRGRYFQNQFTAVLCYCSAFHNAAENRGIFIATHLGVLLINNLTKHQYIKNSNICIVYLHLSVFSSSLRDISGLKASFICSFYSRTVLMVPALLHVVEIKTDASS